MFIDFEVYPVCVPVIEPCISSIGRYNHTIRSIIKIISKDCVGWGETYGDYAIPTIISILGELQNKPINIEAINKRIIHHRDFGVLNTSASINNQSLLAIRMALIDLVGKIHRIPAYQLLNPSLETPNPIVKCSLYSYAIDGTPQEMADHIQTLLQKYPSDYVEFKIGVHGVAYDIEATKKVAEVIGSAKLAVDVNMGYTMDEAHEYLCEVRELIDIIEEPVPCIYDMNQLAKEFWMKISTHCTQKNILDKTPFIHASVPDIHLDYKLNNGKPFWLRSCLELGISHAMMCHTSIAFPSSRANQSLLHLVEDDLCKTSNIERCTNGFKVNPCYGLGVNIDQTKLKKYFITYNNMRERPNYYM
uniref:Enolase C-terminal domain-like protein n=1 Tax=Megaviridae environmental sample TaxID=1737588 RepID=A0A5J6VJU5_9VIRU|nr:MAG: enolase C-terminal domain-like protein [Megaviridae environmental sample]